MTAETKGLVNQTAFARMKPQAVVINVGRGPIIDEQALFDALTHHTIAGAVIDTWYHYPTAANAPHAALVFALSHAGSGDHDPAYVRLDPRHHPPPPANHRPKRAEPRRRQTLHQCGAGGGVRGQGLSQAYQYWLISGTCALLRLTSQRAGKSSSVPISKNTMLSVNSDAL